MFVSVHEVSVLVATLLAIAVGSIWYSPLVFGKYWLEALRIAPEDLSLPREKIIKYLVFGFLAHLLLMYTLAQFVTRLTLSGEGIWETAMLLTLTLSGALGASAAWEQRTLSFFLINVGYAALVVFGGMAIIAYWPW